MTGDKNIDWFISWWVTINPDFYISEIFLRVFYFCGGLFGVVLFGLLIRDMLKDYFRGGMTFDDFVPDYMGELEKQRRKGRK